jgi:2-polyprenyl-6-hydroxyphenyl methylase/3-demethylubiquinone-9 3-methyltransferase
MTSETLTQESPQIEYICTTAESFADLHAGEFDVVTCMELLEHVPDPSRLVNACLRLAKEDGQVFFSTLNRTPKAYVYAVLGAEYLLNMLPKGTHDYRRFVKPSELVSWIRATGKQVQDISGLEYHPVSGKHRLGPNPDINYLLHAS